MIKKLLDEWYELWNKRLEEMDKDDKYYLSQLQECNSLKLSRVSFFLKYWNRNPSNFAKIWTNLENILKDLGYDKDKPIEETEIKKWELEILGVLWITIHEYSTLLKNPQSFGFTSFDLYKSDEQTVVSNLTPTENKEQAEEQKQLIKWDENQRRQDEIKLAIKLKQDFYMIIETSLKRCNDIIDDPNSSSMQSKANHFREIMLMYFINHDSNKFVKEYYNVVPKWSEITKRDRNIAIQMLSNKIARSDREYIRYYGTLAWLNFGLPKTLENYEHTMHMLFFAATWKRSKKPKNIFKGILLTDGDYYEGLEEDEIKYLQHSYLLLAKCVYLPFLYGYDMSSVMNSQIYSQVKNHLEKI